jgi:Neuraminidase (sialidase)
MKDLRKEIKQQFNIDILDLPSYQIGIIQYYFNDMIKNKLWIYNYIEEVIKNER